MGWPAILGSLALSAAGIARREGKWLLGGAVLSAGFAWYLSGSPNPVFHTLGYALPFLHLGGALAVRSRLPWIAWILLIPHALIAFYLGMAVLSQ